MDTLRRRIVGPGLGLAALLVVLSWGPSPAQGQMFGYGMGGYGGYGMGGYGMGGYGGYGMGGYGMGGYGMGGYGGYGMGGYGMGGYGMGGYGMGGYGGYGMGGYGYGGMGYPVGLPSPAYGYYGGGYGYGYGGPGLWNPLFGIGMTPLGVQSALAERYGLGRGLSDTIQVIPARTTTTIQPYPVPATNTTAGAVRP